jgi:Ca2+-dependent lipid-binding protein
MVVMPFDWCEKYRPVDIEEPDVSRYDPFLLAEDHLAETVNELQIGLVRAHSLAIRDLRKWYQKKDTVESSDPRVVFSIKGRPDIQLRSTVREKTLSPAWAESFELELMFDEIAEDPTLTVRIEDYDGKLSKSESMGICEIPLRGREHTRSREWYTLQHDPTNKKGVVTGEVDVVLRWRHVPSRVFKPFAGLEDNLQKCPNELIIGLGRGRGLPIMDKSMFSKGGSSDPRVVVWIEGVDEPLVSSTKKKSLNPCWREVFKLEVPPTLEDPVLHIKCEDWDLVGKPDSMGLVDVPLIDYRIQLGFTSIDHRQKTRQWLALGPDPKAKKTQTTR